ncbi:MULTISPECIES: Lsr2 family protein [unclassified Pseudactinotalea]|uniref:histone-like nucleoid-structuring protein Lsr2 n=1 Tax=unclassified Pseudactinotalea TaxID=2649176 RepID=UPI00128AECC7|nr:MULTISPECIES: Lsr2 family protein [unclassified Pseudactinotalea]MPV48437.1 Lsr2 family protein [Pseudactinotalea sp. HY160]QGH68416.1 Lsr2 family protein [Pseudactinotalea sp. HY158]
MAQKVRVYLIDDIDGSDASETVSFSVDGVSYEIDVNDKHAQELRNSFSTWVSHARRATGGARRGGRRAAAPRSASDAAAVRAWARENGYEVSDRGRVSAEIREAYEQRNR